MWPEAPAWPVPGMGLRLAEARDEAFLRALYRSVRDPELELTGWPEPQRQAFADSQFGLQDRFYREHYPEAVFLVVERDAAPLGRIYVDPAPGPLRLMDIALLPAVRGQGLGTALLQWVLARAEHEGRDVLLYVESHNPARRLYGRHGFLDDGVEGPYIRMRRAPSTGG
ncbi:GNAT family N-acetyltransferase [Xylophilus sp. GW821-FHT01B05]